jgi:hypothetical protein
MISENPSNHTPVTTNVPTTTSKNIPFDELVHTPIYPKHIPRKRLEQRALDKYRTCGKGIVFSDIVEEFLCSKEKAQSKLKRSCMQWMDKKSNIYPPILFRAPIRTIPQQYFPACIRADIIEDFKKRKNVLVQPTGVNLSKVGLFSPRNPLSNAIEHQKAQSFLDVLMLLHFSPPHIHKLQMMFNLDKEYYKELKQNEQPINRAKSYEENIGRRHATYRLSPNGTVEVSIRTTNTPFRIEKDEDVSNLFSFLGQVRDRFLYHVSDIRERHVPPLLDWILKQCDLNKDVEIDEKAQLALPDIQLKSADRVFRSYIKIMKDKAFYRIEESLALNQILPEALDNIRHPYKSIENKIDKLTELIEKNTR